MTIASLDILQPMPLFRQCTNNLGKPLKLFNLDRRFPSLGIKQLSLETDNVPKRQPCKKLIVLFAENIFFRIDLHPGAFIL